MSKLIVTKDLVTAVDVDLDWYAFVTAPQKEYTCAHILRRKGIATFIPTETRWRSTNRYTKSRKLKEEMAFPVVPRHLFAGFPQGEMPPWYWLGSFPLILGVIGKKGRPHPTDRKEFAQFAPVYSNGSLRAPAAERHMRTREEFGVGDNVEVLDGPFRDHQVKVIEINGNMATVVLQLFNTERELPMALETMSRVA
jgi:transcription antitermination factor NusG